MTTIGDRLRRKRMDLGLFQKDVAKQIGVSVCTVTHWELGRTKPKTCYRIGDAAGKESWAGGYHEEGQP